MKISRTSLALLLCLAPLGSVAHAQPDTNNGPKADNPVNRAPRAAMTIAERTKLLIKRQYALLGADDATQNTLAAFVQSETLARQNLAEKAAPLQQALRADGLPDTQIAALLNAYQVAVDDDKARHAQAVTDLQKAVDFKKMPKIEASLTLSGLIGDGPMLTMGGAMGRIFGGQNGRGQNGLGGMANRLGNGRNNRNPAPAVANPPAQAV